MKETKPSVKWNGHADVQLIFSSFTSWCFSCLFRATYEHTTRHVTDRHTEAAHAGVSTIRKALWSFSYPPGAIISRSSSFYFPHGYQSSFLLVESAQLLFLRYSEHHGVRLILQANGGGRHEQKSWLWRHAERPGWSWCRRLPRKRTGWSRWRNQAAYSRGA